MLYGYIACTYVAGIFLCIAPWSGLWQYNYFVRMLNIEHSAVSGCIRGAFSGLGTINLIYALRSILDIPRRKVGSNEPK